MHPICTALGAHIRGAVFQEHFQGEILRAPLNWKKESLSYHFGLLPVVKCESESHSVVSDLYSPWNSLGQRIQPRSPALQVDSLPAEPQGKPKNTGVCSLSLLQWIFLTQELNRSLLHFRWILCQLSY